MQLSDVNSVYSQISTHGGLSPDYISSSARWIGPGTLQTCHTHRPQSGDVIVGCLLDVNPAYPNLELADGREVVLTAGNIIVGCLGTRRALHGFSGNVPLELTPGQALSLLNKGGVMGDCTAFHRDLEWPSRIEYLGTVIQNGHPLNITDFSLPYTDEALPKTPLVLVLGTCMNSGKTTVCETIVKTFSERGVSINGGKVAGVACRQDLICLKEAGAKKVASFHDFGLPSSADVDSLVPLTRSVIHYLGSPHPDFIVLEMGDGILGGYHVASLFSDAEFLERQVCMIICANDLMGAWGALNWMDSKGLPVDSYSIMISGPVTDSGEGIRYLENTLGVPAANPFDCPGKLCSFVQRSLPSC